MKKILSIFVVICMMMTLAPVASFAQAVEFQLKPAQVTYEAQPGQTISVPFLMVPNTTVETQVVGFYINIPDGLTVESVTGGKIPVSSSNGVNVANGKVNVLYDSLITLSPSDATLFTLNCVATTSGSYTLDAVIDGIYDSDFELMGDSNNVEVIDAVLNVDGEVATFESSSTQVKYQGFDNGEFSDGLNIPSGYFPSGSTVDNVIIEGLTESNGYKAQTVKTEDGDLALYMEGNKGGNSGSNNFVPWHARVETQSDYIVAQFNYKTNSQNNDMHFRFWYDDLVEGEMVPDSELGGSAPRIDTWGNSGLPLYFKYNSILRDSPFGGSDSAIGLKGNDNFKWLTENKYQDGNWHKYTFIVDARGFKAYLFIDDEYIMSFTIVRDRSESNYNTDTTTGRYIEGVQLFQFKNDKWNGTVDGSSEKKTWIDDLEVRKMTAEGLQSVIGSDVVISDILSAKNDKLPTTSALYQMPVTWTADKGVTIGEDGSITLADGVEKVENVTLTANVLGATKTYLVTIEGEPVIEEDDEGYTPGIDNNSTLMKKQTFDNGEFSDGLNIPSGYFPSGSTVDNVIIEGISGQGEHTADIKTNEKGNLSLYLRRNVATNSSVDQAFVPWHARVETQSDYIVAKFDYKTNSYNNDMHFRFWYDDLVGGEMVPDSELGGSAPRIDTWGNGGLPLYLKYNSILRDSPIGGGANSIGTKGNDNFKWISENKYQDGNWHTYTFLIDARGFKAYLFIDNEYIMSFTIVRDRSESNYNTDTTTNRYIEGIQLFQFRNGRYSEGGPTVKETWVDNLEVRKMTSEQYRSFLGADVSIDSNISTSDKLPVKSNTYKLPVTWTADKGVTIDEDGSIILTGGVTKVENVALTATVMGASRTFMVTVTGDDASRINGIANNLTTYVFSGQKYVMESFVPNIPGLAGTDTVSITSSDASIAYNASTNKVTVTKGSEDKIVNVTVKITSANGNSVTKTLEFYVPSDSVVSHYEGFDYPSIKGSNISSTDAWSVWNEDTNLSTTGIAYLVESSPDDATDLNMDMNIIRKRDTSKYGNQYAEWQGNAAVAGDAILQANVKFSNTAGNQVVWYVTGNVKTSSGESKKEIASLYIERGSNVLKCEVNGGNSTTTVSTTALPTNEWFNLKFVIHTADNSYDIYIDNVKINSSSIPFKNVTENGVVTSITKLVMGASRWNIAAGHIYIDDIMVRSTTADILSTEAKMLAVPETFIYDYTMPTVGIYEGTTIEWKSNNEAVLSKDGKVNREIGLGDTTVTLTATIQSGDVKYEKTFDVKVVKTPYYTIDALVFETADGNTAYSAVPGGKLKYVSVTKYTTSQSDNATAFVAVYDSVGDLCAVAQPQKVNASGNIELDIELPNEEGLYAKAFIWNSNNLAPLAYSYSTKVSDDAVIYTIGDSTMQTYGTIENRQSDNKMTGWVQVLPLALQGDDLTIENKAVAGTSTLSFTDKGYIYPIYEDIKPGDYLLIQFGHNDEKPWLSEDAQINYSPLEGDHNNHPSANPVPDMFKDRKTYEQWLRDYAAAARMRGAQVIFATSIYRRAFNGDEVSYNHYGYPEAMIDTANELNVPVIDLHARSGEWLQQNGADGSQKYFMSFHGGTDNTHLTYDGAVEIANMAISEMKRIVLPVAQAFTSVPKR